MKKRAKKTRPGQRKARAARWRREGNAVAKISKPVSGREEVALLVQLHGGKS